MRNNNEEWENRPRKNGLAAAEREQLRRSYVESKAVRQAEADLALIKAVELGKRLKDAGL